MAAFMIASAIAMMAMQMIKGKGKGDQDPVVGKRYWTDNIEAFGYYSPRTAKLWYNQMFLNQEELFASFYLPKAVSRGDTFDVGKQAVNTSAVPGFSIEYPGSPMPVNFFDTFDENQRNCAIGVFSRGAGENPQTPSHYPGAATIYINQGFMGLNAASIGNYRAILSALPGTVYLLRSQGPDYEDEGLWVRYRETADCGLTISVNPMTILTDILLDRYPTEEVDWLSAADVGKRLIEQKSFMWFSMAIPPQSYVEVVKDIAKKASIALRRTPGGKVGFRLIGETPPGGIESVPTLDVVKDGFEVVVKKPSNENAEIINEARGTFLAARFVDEEYVAYGDLEEGAAAYSLVTNAEYDLQEKQLMYSAALENPDTDPLELAALASEVNALKSILLKVKSAYDSEEGAYKVMQDFKDGHYLKGGTFAVNPASIMLTGVRSQQNYNLDFLNWPDDAKAYLEDALLLYEHPLSSGNVQTSFAFNSLGVGSLFKMKIAEEEAGLDYQFIAEIGGKTILGFGEERIEFTYKESGRWYGMVAGDPNNSTNPGAIDASPAVITYKKKLPVWAVCALMSPMLRGFPVASLCCNENSPALDAVNYYLTTDCIDGGKVDDSWLTQDSAYFPSVGELYLATSYIDVENVHMKGPGYLHSWELTVKMPIEFGASVDELFDILNDKVGVYSGTMDLFFDQGHRSNNFFAIVRANVNNEANAAGEGFLYRATDIKLSKGDDAVYISLGGIYTCDQRLPQNRFEIGDRVVMFPKTNQLYSYGYGAVPLPASYGLTTVAGNQTFNIKYVPVVGATERDWSSCVCNTMIMNTFWQQTTPCSVMVANRTSPDYSNPELCVYAEADDTIDVWVAAHDTRKVTENRELMGMATAVPGIGTELDVSLMDTPIKVDSNDSSGSLSCATVVIEYFNKATGLLLYAETLRTNKLHHSIVPSDIIPTFNNGGAISIQVTLSYNLPASSVLDQDTVLTPVIIAGPEIRHA